MPLIKSAKKALRQSHKKYLRNTSKKRYFRDLRKTFKESVDAKDKKQTTENLKQIYKTLDKSAKRNIIHKNKANRLKSRSAKKAQTLK